MDISFFRILNKITAAIFVCSFFVNAAVIITSITPTPYIAGDTVRFCTFRVTGIDSGLDSLYISTNLFSRQDQPATKIFTQRDTMIIREQDTSMKFFSKLFWRAVPDTLSFVSYYAPFSSDSLFYIDMKIRGNKTNRVEFSMRPGETAVLRNDKHEWNSYSVEECPNDKIDLLGRRIEKHIQVDPLSGNIVITNRNVIIDFSSYKRLR